MSAPFLDQNKDTINQVNAFLQQAASSLTCGPSCQKAKTTLDLELKLENSKKNLLTAPQQLEEAAKNFYMYTEGEGGYNDYIVSQLTEKANIIGTTLKTDFDEGILKANNLINMYSGIYLNYIHVLELLTNYVKQNIKLENMLKNTKADILTNDRKTFYEDQSIDRLRLYYKILRYIYIIIIIGYLVCIFVLPSTLSKKKHFFILTLLLLYPFIIKPVFEFIQKIISSILSIIPKNVYKTI
jgi:hypothetical protein